VLIYSWFFEENKKCFITFFVIFINQALLQHYFPSAHVCICMHAGQKLLQNQDARPQNTENRLTLRKSKKRTLTGKTHLKVSFSISIKRVAISNPISRTLFHEHPDTLVIYVCMFRYARFANDRFGESVTINPKLAKLTQPARTKLSLIAERNKHSALQERVAPTDRCLGILFILIFEALERWRYCHSPNSLSFSQCFCTAEAILTWISCSVSNYLLSTLPVSPFTFRVFLLLWYVCMCLYTRGS